MSRRSLDCHGRTVRAERSAERIEVHAPTRLDAASEALLELDEHPLLDTLGLTWARLRKGKLEFRGRNHLGLARGPRIIGTQLVLRFTPPGDRHRVQACMEAACELSRALEREADRAPWRALALRHGWAYAPLLLSGDIGAYKVSIENTDGLTRLKLRFESGLSLGFRAATPERLGEAGTGFDNTVLDLLLAVCSPPQDERFHEPELVESMLEVLHGQGGVLGPRSLTVEVEGRLLDPGPTLEAMVRLVDRLRR